MPLETIEGIVEEIIFCNPENGWTVLCLQPQAADKKSALNMDEVIVVGKLLDIQPGESVRFTGTWTVHKEYGEQFKAEAMHLLTHSANDLQRFLASGQIEGLGPETAQRIIQHFGAATMDILDESPERIHEVPGIKPTHAKRIASSWAETRRSRKVMMFLQNYNITAGLAHKIYDAYGEDTIEEIQSNPYRLAFDIEGVDFKTADQIAQNMGLAGESTPRIRAGIQFALTTLGSDGHIYVPRPMLIEKAGQMLEVPPELCNTAITALLRSKDLIAIKKMPVVNATSPTNVEAVYSRRMYSVEHNVAKRLYSINQEKKTRLPKAKKLDWAALFTKIARNGNIELTEQQQDAVQAALTNKISVLTGGPGTGKTTTLRAVIQALDEVGSNYALASPTGRAARRLSEATDRPASTIHRLLGYTIDGDFASDEDHPLDADIVVVDEASMIDLELFSHLLAAITDNAHLMLVGDVDQLPSVGAGDVLHDVIRSGLAHVTRLALIFRQSRESLIVHNAHLVNHGEMPDLSNNSSDFFLFGSSESDPAALVDLLVDVVQNRIPSRFGLHPLNDVQVLAPMYKGDIGIHTLNEHLQAALNPVGEIIDHQVGTREFRLGDKVIQTRNNYEKEVYNGDIGRVASIDPVDRKMEINIDGRLVEYKFHETGDLFHAYAISIHRSQGAEYPAVVIPIVTQHSRMLQRNLLYTAITRAKQLVVLVGTRRAIQIAVENDRVAQRYSGLLWQLEQLQAVP